MKRLFTILTVVLLLFVYQGTQAQAFDKSTKLISIGIGAADMWHFSQWGNAYGVYGLGSYAPITGQISIQGEFPVHKYVGIGFNTGIGGRASSSISGFNYGYPGEFNIPIGAIGNFHFYQLIAEKTGKGSKLHSDKLDIYAGLNLGSGIAIHPADSYYFGSTQYSALFWIGSQVGINYYFTDKLGIKGELGYGKTIFNAALVFKMGGGKSSKK